MNEGCALDGHEHHSCGIVGLKPTNVIKPNPIVVQVKKILGPRRRTAMVAGSWKHTLATVKMRIDTEKRLSRSRPRSCSMDVTEALEIMPLSIKFKLVNTPPMVQSLRSIFHFNFFSLSDSPESSSIDLLLCSISLPPSEVADRPDIRKEHAMVLY